MAKVYCFGNTENGELGLGGIEEDQILKPRKQRLPHDRRKYTLLQLASGKNHTLLLLRNVALDRNTLFSCGSNERLQLGRGGSWKRLEAVDGLASHNIVQIACGTYHNLVLSEAGQLFSWGCNLFGQLGLSSQEPQEIAKPSLIKKLAAKNIVQIACGGYHCLALTKNGELYSWGSNAFGQLGIGTHNDCHSVPEHVQTLEWTPIAQIAAGGSHSAILSCTGAIFLWGKNEFGQLGLSDQRNRLVPSAQSSLRHQRVSYISLGEDHSAAITAEGGLFTWGAGMYGQLGHGKNVNESLPRKVFELMGRAISQVSCGRCHTLVATEHGRVYSFGLNGSGQLGVGSRQHKSVPSYVSGPWIETNMKDLLPRYTEQSLSLPNAKVKHEMNAIISDCIRHSPSSTSLNKNTNESNRSASSASMEIDELNDEDDDGGGGGEPESSGSGNVENFIIEEPDDESAAAAARISAASVPEFLCKDETVFPSRARDHLVIDEYVSDPDSDMDEPTHQRKQTMIKQIFASKGDQSFVFLQPFAERAAPRDLRKFGAETAMQIFRLDNEILEQFKAVSKGESLPFDVVEYVENVFFSAPCWNASYIAAISRADRDEIMRNRKFVNFLSQLGVDLDAGFPVDDGAIAWRDALHGFNMIEDADNERIDGLITQAALTLLAKSEKRQKIGRKQNSQQRKSDHKPHHQQQQPPQQSPQHDSAARKPLDEEVLRIFQLLPLFHRFRMTDAYCETSQQLITAYSKAILALEGDESTLLQICWARMPKHYLKNMIHIFKKSIEFNLLMQHEENIKYKQLEAVLEDEAVNVAASTYLRVKQQLHSNLATCLDVVKLLYDTNKSIEIVSYKEFYIEGIADKFDLRRDYVMWKLNRQNPGVQYHYLCNYAFILDAPAKNHILATDSEIQQESAARYSMEQQVARQILTARHGSTLHINPYLVISVHRNTILHETINQLCVFCKHSVTDFKKPLQVLFEGEEAIDAGQGMKKEFFLLLMKEILDEKYGMFIEYPETRTIWFHHANFEDDVMYKLIGILCGLAIYNQVIINLPFPLVLYKRILRESLELDDLAYLDPQLSKNLKEILNTGYAPAEFDAIFGEMTFTITLQTFGSPVEYELCAGGNSRRLRHDNREEYVRLYWQYILESAVEKQFASFRAGFMNVLDTDILQIFHAEELMQMVSGQEVTDWEELQSVTEYKPPFSADHPTIQLFWRVFHAFTAEEKKKFLMFLTGSDRIPILGLRALKLTIQAMKVSEDHLPVAHTCFNVLDLPETYTCDDRETIMRSKLLKACEYSKEFALV